MVEGLKPGKFVCPSGFVQIEGHSVLHLEDLASEDTELWIIQAPTGMDMTKFENHPIDLRGSTKISFNGDNVPNVECFASEYTNDENGFHLILPKKSDNKLSYVPKPFKGHMIITECINMPDLKLHTGRVPYEIAETDSENEEAVRNDGEPESHGMPKKKKRRKTLESSATEELVDLGKIDKSVSIEPENSHGSKRKHKKSRKHYRDVDWLCDSPLDNSLVKIKPSEFETSSSIAESRVDFQTSNDEERPRKKKKKKKHKRKEENPESTDCAEFANNAVKTEPNDEDFNNGECTGFDKSDENSQVQSHCEEESTSEIRKKKKKHKKVPKEFVDVEIKAEANKFVASMSENLSLGKKSKKKQKMHVDDY